MNSIWILLVFLSITSAKETDPRTVKFTCLGDGRAKFQINTTANDKMNNIFSTDPPNSCSLSNGDFTGNGTADFPYEITVDTENNPCGAKVDNDSFSVEFAIKTNENFFAKHDHKYTMECKVQSPHVIHGSFRSQAVNSLRYENVMKMKLMSTNSTDDKFDGKMILGQKVKLKIEFSKTSRVERGRVTLCYVKDSLRKEPTFFYSNKCSVKGNSEIDVDFSTNKTNRKLIESTEFKAFKLYDEGRITFICYVELCFDKSDTYCSHPGCVPLGTFLHSYTMVETAVLSSTTNKMSHSLLPVTAILILLTKSNWV